MPCSVAAGKTDTTEGGHKRSVSDVTELRGMR